jgi:predicted negative regulator of RcsB-dependent stress response
MNKDNNDPKNSVTPAHHNDELAEVKELLDKYGKNALTALLAVMVAVAAIHFYTARKQKHNAEAVTKLSAARSIPDLEDIVANYGKTQPAEMAMIALAKQYYDTANYEEALAKYDEFISKYPDTRLTDTAKLGRVFCIEARGTDAALEDAASAYASFTEASPESFLAPQAIFGQARCLERLNRKDEARVLYEDFIANRTDSPWLPLAEDLLKKITETSATTKPADVKAKEAAAKPPATDNNTEK